MLRGIRGVWGVRPYVRTVGVQKALPRRGLASKKDFEAMPLPCVDQHDLRERQLRVERQQGIQSQNESTNAMEGAGPEPAYQKTESGYEVFLHPDRFELDYGGALPSFQIAYETWGSLNEARDNAILLHTGLSASSHAASTDKNPAKGWWEDFIGPGKALDTNRFYVICTNVLGSCFGSTGPSSPCAQDGEPYATRFPILSIFDMIRAQFLLLDHLGIDQLYASIGSSMGGMQSIAAAHLYPSRVKKMASISGTARSAPSGIALRYAQRSVLMADPNWNRGFYYGPDQMLPHTGMKLARQIATITYRSGPEWEQRFGRIRRTSNRDLAIAEARIPALCPDFLVETYLDHQGEQFCLKYDANSLIYISKSMDLFDMSEDALAHLGETRALVHGNNGNLPVSSDQVQDLPDPTQSSKTHRKHISTISNPGAHHFVPSLARGLSRLRDVPTLIIGVQSDILFPVDQQRELAECLRMNGNRSVMYYELDAPHGHDSFLYVSHY